MRFSGSYVALVTPFHADGSVNFEKLRELVEWHVQQGTDGIVALGTTGEYFLVGGIVNTLLDAFDGTDVTLTVNGAALETGHDVYDTALTRYEG